MVDLPRYVELYESGELQRRVLALEERLGNCDVCPRRCGANRLEGEIGLCNAGKLVAVSSVCAHRGEEPALSGTKGSGAVFFGNCNLRCVYCQNYQISQDPAGQRHHEVTPSRLANRMLHVQNDLRCHNLNLVSPTQYVPQIMRALLEAIPHGFRLPIVYNTNAYEELSTLQELDGVIDIYLPDLKYSSNTIAMQLSDVAHYVPTARSAIKEMYRQVGDLQVGEDGIALKGLIIRHLILPNDLAGSEESLKWIARELSPQVTVSIMSQYIPRHKALGMPPLARSINAAEHRRVVNILDVLGMENGWMQEAGSQEFYLPDFTADGHPFERG
ncbi:putative pyruvate formate lyase activating enzyme [Dehalogenimonas formicexedens]|uniref:Putative pyruvate formate lyase activating enzyme n=1 Tax=Dehalogenimonas formicexedens TaxID=1839801 RepID=A0A1P8F4Z3_9CHLR|nr:radical SAM protein [Dehalogenimonas formicexedens]APV43515.1 putative pyruvate formate lyase activating enzyme [Dehalogenimonas formicexedens]